MTRAELITHLEHLAEYVKYSEDAPALREVIEMLKETHEERTETHACDLISRQAILALPRRITRTLGGEIVEESVDIEDIKKLPSAQPERDILSWLIAYHTKSFDLHGRYMPHEVIWWLVHDFANAYMAERRTDE